MTAALVPVAEGTAARVSAAGAAKTGSKLRTESKSVSNAKSELSGKRPANSQSRPTPSGQRKPSGQPSSRSRSERRHSGSGRGAAPRRHRPTSSRGQPPHVGILIAEWLLGVIIITATVPFENLSTGYLSSMSKTMLRLTGVTGVFFVLALLGTAEKMSKFVLWFGLLVDLGIIYRATTHGGSQALTAIFSGNSAVPGNATGGHASVAADWTKSEDHPVTGLITDPPKSGGSVSGGTPASNSGGASISPLPNYTPPNMGTNGGVPA